MKKRSLEAGGRYSQWSLKPGFTVHVPRDHPLWTLVMMEEKRASYVENREADITAREHGIGCMTETIDKQDLVVGTEAGRHRFVR